MKACVIQPPYSMDYSNSDACFAWELEALDNCGSDLDLIVLPEYSNIPCIARTKAEMEQSQRKYSDILLNKSREVAKRCNAHVFVSGIFKAEEGLRNSTIAINKQGEIVGRYDKQHLVNSEMYVSELEAEYTFDFSEPTIIELDGIRYGFLTCYDFYFYEGFANLARKNPDVIIGCSHQRSDLHSALETMCKFIAYNCNAYVVRASISLGEDSPVGGSSMIVTPKGDVLTNLKSHAGVATAEFDPHERYLKPAGFGNPPDVHHNYIDAGRRPWKYRPAGSAIARYDGWMKYPRVSAQMGFCASAPKNSLPAFASAIALGANEIELDLRATKDGVIICAHDRELSGMCDGKGNIDEYTYEELLKFDFGAFFGDSFKGLSVTTFEAVLSKLACHAVMNLHIKTPEDTDGPFDAILSEIVRLIDKYDCRRHCYFMSGDSTVLNYLRSIAPDIARCAGEGEDPTEDIVKKALSTGSKKIQFYKPFFEAKGENYLADTIKKAHENGIICNVAFADDAESAKEYLALGADVILTNEYLKLSKIIK